MSETQRVSLDDLESGAYNSIALAKSFEETTTQLQVISEALSNEELNNWELRPFASHAVWGLGDDALRYRVAVGSIATQSWPRRVSASPVRALYFKQLNELVQVVHETDEKALATTSLVAVARRYHELAGYIPSAVIPWAIGVGGLQDMQAQQCIGEALTGLRFSDRHIDSEDMHDAHPVAPYLFDHSLSEVFRQKLLDITLADINTTLYKPWAWQSQLNITLKVLADDRENPLRFRARKQLSLPEQDGAYSVYSEQEASKKAEAQSERVRRSTEQQAQHEARLDTAKAQIKTLIAQILHR